MKKEKNDIKKSQKREFWFALGIVIVPILWWAFSFFYTTTDTIFLAFKKYNPLTHETLFCGLQNFGEVFADITSADGVLNVALKNSLLLWIVNVCVAIPIAVIVSFAIHKNVYGGGIFKVILFLPHVVSSMVWVLIYKTFIEYGIGADWLVNQNTNFNTLWIYSLWLGFAGNMVLYTGAMSRIPPSLVEAGHLDGMSDMQEFIHIVLPLIFPTLSVVLTTCIISVFSISLPVYVFYGQAVSVGAESEHLYTLGFYTFIRGLGQDMTQTPIISALSIVVCLIAAPVTLGIRRLLTKIGPTVEY